MKKIKASNEIIKVDLACGQRKQDGYIGVDNADIEGVDIVYDLESFPWKWAEDNSIDHIYCAHYIEHTKDIIKFMDELHRILKPAKFAEDNPNIPVSGYATIIAPYYNSVRCWQDPTHTRAISENTFLYYNKAWRDQNGLDHYGSKANFNFGYSYNIAADWRNRSQETLSFAMRHYTNVIDDIIVTLTKI